MGRPGNKKKAGRGTLKQVHNRFDKYTYSDDEEAPQDVESSTQTEFLKIYPKTILNKIDSPDIDFSWGMNPYQGCEHGCIYCYARTTHEYWGYNAGLDFEKKIMVKTEAPDILQRQLRSKSWKGQTIMLSGNTDCYQPIERKMKITRKMLEICEMHQQSVGIITKNALISRDLDILEKMAKKNLVRVAISITSRDEQLRRILEPRTSSFKAKMNTVTKLSAAGIPVNVMMAPIIPGLNDHEIMKMARDSKKAGAHNLNYTMIRLGGPIKGLFENWLKEYFPDRYNKVMKKIIEAHEGSTTSSRFGERMIGKGHTADIIRQQIHLAKARFKLDQEMPPLNTSLFRQRPDQLKLF